jgi:uncharacterized integral membrane protein (TIGR00698 family)
MARIRKALFLALPALCLLPQIGTASALVGGILFALIVENPWPNETARWSKKLLQLSVVGLGFGMSIGQIWQEGKTSAGFTVIGIMFTLGAGTLLGKMFRTPGNTSALISFGTAICGGSAIAAMAPVIEAENEEIVVALATVFTLNSAALLLFPPVGHLFHLDPHAFGVWAGLAIHDTSSVVGAAASYGSAALGVATTVKLTRAIWIAPFVAGAGWLRNSGHKVTVPPFIIGFVAAAALRSVLPQYTEIWKALATTAQRGLVVTLFLIGAGLSGSTLKSAGIRPLLQGVVLWFLVSGLTLLAILKGFI